MEKYSMNFGKKERVLNYACQTYQLSRPNKVGAVMALIRDFSPYRMKNGKNGTLRMRIRQARTRRKLQSRV